MENKENLYYQMPFYMTYPMQNLYLTEMEYEKDMERMKELYPREVRKLQEMIERRCDEMEYEGSRMLLATTKGGSIYTDVKFQDGDMILFGKETAGLPRDFIEEHKESAIRIPMSKDTRLRSLNLSNSANIILFEALRQLGFPELK